MKTVAFIAGFGALGCLARYYLSVWVYGYFGRGFPYGTFVVNIIGAFFIGLLMEFSLQSTLVSSNLRIGLAVGFMGGLTTFSTFSYETFRLLEDGQFFTALANVLASVVVCLALTWAGIYVARQLT
jgi:CrcB protein